MALRRVVPFVALLLSSLMAVRPVTCLSKADLFVYGEAASLDRQQHQLIDDSEDFNSVELALTTPIVFYQQSYQSVYINENGVVSFLTEIPSFFSIPFPLDYPAIAPFYSDVDIRTRGAVWYRESRDSLEIKRASRLVQQHFSSGRGFEAKDLVIVTWDDVGYYDRGTDLANTFQLVIATDGQDSFVLFAFPEKGLQWIQGTGKNANLPDARAQSGFVSGDGRFYVLKGSGSDQVSNLDRLSNVGVAGYWMFRVGQIGESNDVESADLATGDSTLQQPQVAETCAIGAVVCHSKAKCVDYHPGFCCQCSAGYFGNGRNCLPDGVPQRINGKLSGRVNGVVFRDEDLHSYVVTSDGRAYTAISKINETIGYDLQTLNLGGVIGWMFARPTSNASNGYQLTGGRFNFTTVMEFPQSGHRVVTEQRFLGVDVFNYLRMSVSIQGDVPSIPYGSKVEIPDFEEEYVKVGLGRFRSQARRVLRMDGSTLDIPFTVDHSIEFEECPFSTLADSTVFKLKVARNFVTFDLREEIIRFAMTNKISPVDETEDPCVKGRATCVPNSTCVPDRDSFRCVCNKGFEYLYEEGPSGTEKATCIDINECNIGHDRCDENALCINEPGSYQCRCKAGYIGDGFTCQRETACMRVKCRANSRCVEKDDGLAECQCLPGYQDTDHQCQIITGSGYGPIGSSPDCRQIDSCDINALCEYDSRDDTFRCRCLRGYVGDGITCTLQNDSCEIAANCSPFAKCAYEETTRSYACRCLPGFEGDGYVCVRPTCVLGVCWCPDGHQYIDGRCQQTPANTNNPKASCNEVNVCHPHAQCIRSPLSAQEYICQCNAGYVGDGFLCTEAASTPTPHPPILDEEEEELSCDLNDICGNHATCIYNDDTLKSECVCNDGYRGDGITCTPIDGCSGPSDCHLDAQCQFSDQHQRYQCQCNSGFEGDGKTCRPLLQGPVEEPDCNQLRNCHPKADCTLDEFSLRHVCVCRSGFNGDGIECRPAVIGCNVINNCHSDAKCLYDDVAAGFRCKCNQGYSGNGTVCRPSVSCVENRHICHADAVCEWNPDGYHTCRCNQGFKGDGYQCQAIPKHDSNILLISHGMSILRVPITPSPLTPGRPIYIQIFQAAVGIDIDCDQGRVYWSDVNGRSLRSAKYDGSDHRVFISNDIGSPEGIAIDWVSRNVYWTDSSSDTIEVANLETKVRRVLVNSSLVNPRGIAVHPARGLLFWTDWNRDEPKIERSDADGSNRQVLITRDIQLPNSLTIDYQGDRLCWADAGVFRIECSDLDGNNRRVIRYDVKYPFGLTHYNGRLFWTDWQEKVIRSAVLESGESGISLPVPLGGQGKIYGIVAVPEICPLVYSPCHVASGGCDASQLCLPSASRGRTCL